MNFSIENFVESNLSPNAYLLLYSFIIDNLDLAKHIHNKTGDSEYRIAYFELQELGYIKITAEEIWIPRQKLLSLRNSINPEPQFEEFWDKYHEVTGLRKTDLQPTIKYWKKLTKSEKQQAIDNIEKYYDSLPIYSTGRPVKKARTYLGDKNFNDEFEVVETKSSLNKMK